MRTCENSVMASSGDRPCGRPADFYLSYPSGDLMCCDTCAWARLSVAIGKVTVQRISRQSPYNGPSRPSTLEMGTDTSV